MGDHKHKKSYQKDTLTTIPGQPAEQKRTTGLPGMEGILTDTPGNFKVDQGILPVPPTPGRLQNPGDALWPMADPLLQKRADQTNSLLWQKREYLVEGAELQCSQGSSKGRLKIPKGHHYLSGDRKKANCKDCVEEENIPYFGSCPLNRATGRCEGFKD